MRRVAPLLALLAVSCPPLSVERGALPEAPSLEQAAIARGIVPDPDAADIVGLYARDTDRLCIVASGLGYRVGASVDYGDGIGCYAAGRAARSGDELRLDFGDECAFAARYDGEQVTFPATVPAACTRACTRRATLGAVSVARVSDLPAEAAAMRDPRGRTPCAG